MGSLPNTASASERDYSLRAAGKTVQWTELFARRMLQEMRGCLCHGGAFIFNQAATNWGFEWSQSRRETFSGTGKSSARKRAMYIVYKYSVNEAWGKEGQSIPTKVCSVISPPYHYDFAGWMNVLGEKKRGVLTAWQVGTKRCRHGGLDGTSTGTVSITYLLGQKAPSHRG